jgi:hypothetical protein
MIVASMGLRRNKDNPAAKIRIRIIGLLNWAKRSVSASDFFLGFRRFHP